MNRSASYPWVAWRNPVIATMALWLVALVVVVLIFNEAVSPYYQRQAATRATTPA